MENFKNIVIRRLNTEFTDIQSLKNAKELLKKVESEESTINSQLSFATSTAPGKIEKALHDADSITTKSAHIRTENQTLCTDISTFLQRTKDMNADLKRLILQIEELERCTKYLNCIEKIEELCSNIQSALLIDSFDRAVSQYLMLYNFEVQLKTSQSLNLKEYVNKSSQAWFSLVYEKLLSEFENALAAHRWPFIASTIQPNSITPTSDSPKKFDTMFLYLLRLSVVEKVNEFKVNSFISSLPYWKKLSLPIMIMLKPFLKRFRYHFFGKKQTNSLDKPEWYFTQILTWIRDHEDFLKDRVQPVLTSSGISSVDVIVEFSTGLVVMAMEKMLIDIPELLYDENNFSHLVDETLLFDKELSISHNYPTQNHIRCLDILTQDLAFKKWILIEKKYALEKMDVMLSSESAWVVQSKDLSETENLRIPECGETFINLLITITDRYRSLRESKHKLRFVQLQIDLLDDFRIRLLQIRSEVNNNPLGSCFCSILNTTSHIENVLVEWANLVFFIELHHFQNSEKSNSENPVKVQAADDVSLSALLFGEGTTDRENEESMFDEMIHYYRHVKNDMLNCIIHYVMDDVKARSRPYRKDRWMTNVSPKELQANLALSNSACEMFIVLKNWLQTVSDLLSSSLFNYFWQKVAEDLDKYLFEELILSNHFTESGAIQLDFDMNRNLFPLFGEYTLKPKNFFKNVKECCILLTVQKGSALLLQGVLKQAIDPRSKYETSKPVDPHAALNKIGIYKLSLEEANLVLNLRSTI